MDGGLRNLNLRRDLFLNEPLRLLITLLLLLDSLKLLLDDLRLPLHLLLVSLPIDSFAGVLRGNVFGLQ